MFDFNKRDSAQKDEYPPAHDDSATGTDQSSSASTSPRRSTSGRNAAVIGPSIHIEGDLRGEEDLIIEGEVKGTINLKSNGLTIGSKGKVMADVFAHTITVDGTMEGDLYGAEHVSIRKNAQVKGNIISPRVSLEDGARFRGSIEMDPEAEALQSAFGSRPYASGNSKAAATISGSPSTSGSTSTSAKSDSGKVAIKEGSQG